MIGTYPKRFRPVPFAEVLAAVFAPLPWLRGVTDEQIRVSWEAVDRLSDDAAVAGEG